MAKLTRIQRTMEPIIAAHTGQPPWSLSRLRRLRGGSGGMNGRFPAQIQTYNLSFLVDQNTSLLVDKIVDYFIVITRLAERTERSSSPFISDSKDGFGNM